MVVVIRRMSMALLVDDDATYDYNAAADVVDNDDDGGD